MNEFEEDEIILKNIRREALSGNSIAWGAWALLQINDTLYRALIDVEDSTLATISNDLENIAAELERHRKGEE